MLLAVEVGNYIILCSHACAAEDISIKLGLFIAIVSPCVQMYICK